jgi:myosin-crossreactive antigen|tara:strand:+ start:429 stop:734 length:306 start_codon:yes stop_codon:yes gene_type:complete
MEKILENLWVLFIAIGSWMVNRLTAKIDELEKGKADGSALGQQGKLIHELDRRVDELGHTSISRAEFKGDVIALHTRLNEHEQRKADRIQQIKIVDEKKGR